MLKEMTAKRGSQEDIETLVNKFMSKADLKKDGKITIKEFYEYYKSK